MVKKKKTDKTIKTIILRTKEERVSEILEIFKKLKGLGLNTQIDGIVDFKKITNEYIENGGSYNGSIKLYGCKRVLTYILPEKVHIHPQINLIYNENI